jgi:hypothetical protein
MVAWSEVSGANAGPDTIRWRKTERINVEVELPTPTQVGNRTTAGQEAFSAALGRVGAGGLAAEVCAEVEPGRSGPELVITLLNISPVQVTGLDTNLYETHLEVEAGPTTPFILDNLPDSFRYDRRVAAYGVNGGVRVIRAGVFATTDYAIYDKIRPMYWDSDLLGPPPDLSPARLANEPLISLQQLVSDLSRWVDAMWSTEQLRQRSIEEGWDDDTLQFALQEAETARTEVQRVRSGLEILQNNEILRRAFMLANRSFARARAIGTIRYDAWRPFQLGFVLANLESLSSATGEQRLLVDTLWFATGGGKTETYLLFTLTAAFCDRLRGKLEGITSWARFPLRMLSLQQTQRFVDLMTAAELVRRDERILGAEFSVGFFVGADGTPNRISLNPRPGEPDPNDSNMPMRYRVLIRCPFCNSETVQMRFDRARWSLDHVCASENCSSRGAPIAFRVVDEEIFRSLPTVVVGTLDKAASIAIQAAMRGFYAPPLGRCPVPGHGFTYAPRSDRPKGCLYPGCTADPIQLSQDACLFGPILRMQDELHLLRDSLGSVDSHYEALLDDLQARYGERAKIIASSATLSGYDIQVGALYRRAGRIFPVPGPQAGRSFWFANSSQIGRRYVGVAPRGVTLEYANDQLTETLQRVVRRALTEPEAVVQEVGIQRDSLDELVNFYGVDVVYGSTLKDVEAATRSFEAQITLSPVNSATLTGRTPLEDVRSTLQRLIRPEPDFADRLHLVAASSMLSHGVDIDRLNVMVMLGLPLTTSEFIQTTARIGRTYPGLVFVLHKIGRERDAAVFRIFPSFVEHMDRLVEPIPITRRSRRILELTYPGLEQARVYGVYEPAALSRGLRPLTVPARLRQAVAQLGLSDVQEIEELINMLLFTGPLDENLRSDITDYVREFFRELNDPATNAQFVSDLFSRGKPMMSLRDVEEQIPIYSREGR